MSKQKRSFGALPPPSSEWQMGKTEASISFVALAEFHIGYASPNEEDKSKLREAIEKIKKGELVLTKETSLAEYLVQQK